MKKFMQSAMAATILATTITATAAKKNTFQAVTSQLDQNSDYFNYSRFNVQSTVDGLGTWLQKLGELDKTSSASDKVLLEDGLNLVKLLFKDSGVFDIQAIGQSSLNKGDHYLNKSLLYSSSTEGSLFKMMGGKSHDLTALNFLPKQTVLATSSDLNLEVLWTQLAKVAAKSKNPQIQMGVTMLPGILSSQGVDLNKLLASLDQEIGFFVCADESKITAYPIDRKMVKLPKMDATIFLKTKTPYLKSVYTERLKSSKFKTSNFDTYTVYEIPNQSPLATPAIAISADYIFISSDKTRLLESLQNFKDKQGLVTTESFSKLSKGIPSEGNGFSYFAPKTIDMFIKPFEADMKKDQQEAILLLKSIVGDDLFFYGVNQVREDGIMATNNFTFRQDTLGGGGVTTAATTGILAAMIMPALAKSQAKAKQAARRNTMKQVGVNIYAHLADNPDAKKCPEVSIAFEGLERVENDMVYIAEGVHVVQGRLMIWAVENPVLVTKHSKSIFVLLSDGSVLPVMGKYTTVADVIRAATIKWKLK